MAPIFGYLIQFEVDFKEQKVVLVNDLYLLKKLVIKTRHTWGKNGTPRSFTPPRRIINGVKMGLYKISNIII